MRTTLLRAVRSVLLFVAALVIGALLGDRPAFARPQAGPTGPAVKDEQRAIEQLQLKESTALALAAPNAFGSAAQCDSGGDIFVRLANYNFTSAQMSSDSAVSEIILDDSKRVVAYGTSPLSPSDYPNSRLKSFSVLPKGVVYALIITPQNPTEGNARPQPVYYVERFKDDGTVDSSVHIETPPGAAHWFADLMAAFPDGSLLVVGTSSPSAEQPSASSWHPFTGIYDHSGRFVREVTLPDDVVNDNEEGGGPVQQGSKSTLASSAGSDGMESPQATKSGATARAGTQGTSTQPSKPRELFGVAISTGGLVSGPDGNVWILRASDPIRLYAVDSSGEVIKHFQLSYPARGLKPFEFGFAGREMVFFDFVHLAVDPSPPSGPSKLVGLFNTVSERFEGLYTLPDTEKGFRVFACSDRHGGFLYLGGTSDNHLGVFDYKP